MILWVLFGVTLRTVLSTICSILGYLCNTKPSATRFLLSPKKGNFSISRTLKKFNSSPIKCKVCCKFTLGPTHTSVNHEDMLAPQETGDQNFSSEGSKRPFEQLENDFEQSEIEERPERKRNGRRKINIEYIKEKSRRHITFSKRKAGIMKKAYELSTLTGTQVLLLVASETGHVYTFATPKLQPIITQNEGKNLIQNCLNAADPPPTHPEQLQLQQQQQQQLQQRQLQQQLQQQQQIQQQQIQQHLQANAAAFHNSGLNQHDSKKEHDEAVRASQDLTALNQVSYSSAQLASLTQNPLYAVNSTISIPPEYMPYSTGIGMRSNYLSGSSDSLAHSVSSTPGIHTPALAEHNSEE